MRSRATILRLVCLATWLGALGASAEKVTYDDHILPIFENSCTNCHNPDKKKGGLDLSSYTSMMAGGSGGKVAVPGEGGDSRIFLTTTHSEEPFMPPKGDKLDKKQLTLIRAWIDGGLLESKDSRVKKSTQTKIDFNGSTAGKPEGPPPMPENLSVEPVVTPDTSTAIHAMVSSPWAPLIAMTGQSQVLLYHSDALELIGVLPFPKGQPTALSFHPSGSYLTAAGGVPGKSGTTVTWEVKTGEVVATTAREYDSILATSMRLDLQAVATGGPSRLVKSWQTADNTIEHSIKKHTDWVTAMAYSNDGVLLASADRNGGMWVWESYSGLQLHELRGHQELISKVAWSADSNFLASSSEDGDVRFWDMRSGKQIKKLDAHNGGVLGFDWSKGGQILTAGRDKKIKLWKSDYKLVKEWKSPTSFVTKACFSHDAKRFFTADFEGRVLVWDSKTHETIGEISSVPASIADRLVVATEMHSEASAASAKVHQELKQAEESYAKLAKQHQDNSARLVAAKGELKQTDEQIKQSDQEQKKLDREITQVRRKIDGLKSQVKIKTADHQRKDQALKQAADDYQKQAAEVAKAQESIKALTAELEQADVALSKSPEDEALKKARVQKQSELTKEENRAKSLGSQLERLGKLKEQRSAQADQAHQAKKAAIEAQKKEEPALQALTQAKEKEAKQLQALKKKHAELRQEIPRLERSLPTLVKQRDAEKKLVDERKAQAEKVMAAEKTAQEKVASLQKAK